MVYYNLYNKAMVSYHGGKQRIGKEIASIIHDTSINIEDNYNFTIKGYCEPFCGMLGVYQHIPKMFEGHNPRLKYKAGDINESVVKMWQAVQKGWIPPSKVTKTEFENLKYAKPSAKKGFVGHQCSFGGLNFGQFRKERCTGAKIKNGVQNVQRIGKETKQLQFNSGTYTQFSNLKGYIIYCDPPYSKRNAYRNNDNSVLKFDHPKFWEWCRKMATHNIIFISEYSAPKDFFSIKVKKTKTSYGAGNTSKNTEKLYFLY